MAAEISPSTVVCRSSQVVSERFESETLVLEPVDDRYVRLNGTGSILWAAMESPARVSDLADVLARECRVSGDRARADVVAFVGALGARGLVEVTPG
jgi:hypothetical protein